jgi:hypothetical protein
VIGRWNKFARMVTRRSFAFPKFEMLVTLRRLGFWGGPLAGDRVEIDTLAESLLRT